MPAGPEDELDSTSCLLPLAAPPTARPQQEQQSAPEAPKAKDPNEEFLPSLSMSGSVEPASLSLMKLEDDEEDEDDYAVKLLAAAAQGKSWACLSDFKTWK